MQKLQRKHIIAFAGHNIHTDSHMVWCGVCGCTTRLRYFKALQTFSDSYSFIFPGDIKRETADMLLSIDLEEELR